MRVPIPLLCLGVLAAVVARVAAATTRWPDLAATLGADLAASRAPGAAWGVLVANADSGTVWFATNQTRLFVPASNTKLFAVALAFQRFGPDHRFATGIALDAPPDASGTSTGTVWIRGGGVPFAAATDSRQSFAPIVQWLSKQGLRHANGGIALDGSSIDAPPFGSGWNWDDLQEAYAPAVGPFVWNGNAATVVVRGGTAPGQPAATSVSPFPDLLELDARVVTSAANQPAHLVYRRDPGSTRLRITGSVPANAVATERFSLPDPRAAFARAFRASLATAHVSAGDSTRIVSPGEPGPARWESIPGPAVATLASDCLKPSDNLLAHLFLLQVGADTRRHPRPGDPVQGDDEVRGIAALATFLGTIGVTGNDAFFEEGSGLSRKNLVSPDATVRLLRHARSQAWGKAYLDALPVGGVDGTLASRFREGPARGNVRAKTGSLRHVHALSGHVRTAGGQSLVFSIYANGFQSANSAASGRAEIDRIVDSLAGFAGRGPE